MQIKIGKEFTFAAAHQLPNHLGKCAHVHGHNYKVQVWLKGDMLERESRHPSEGMLEDFAELTEWAAVIEALDHKTLRKGDEIDLMSVPREDVYELGLRTTAENIAYHIWQVVAKFVRSHKEIGLMGVIVWETDKCFAEYISPLDVLRPEEKVVFHG